MPKKFFSCTRGHPALKHSMMMNETKKALYSGLGACCGTDKLSGD